MALTEDKLIEFLRDSLDVTADIGGSSELFSTGLLDSVAMLNLIAFVEEVSRVEVRPGDVTLENFDTPGRIIAYVQSLG